MVLKGVGGDEFLKAFDRHVSQEGQDSLDIKCVHVCLKILDPGIQDVASLTPSSVGEDTQDMVVMPAAAAASAPGECFILSYFFVVLITTRPRC